MPSHVNTLQDSLLLGASALPVSCALVLLACATHFAGQGRVCSMHTLLDSGDACRFTVCNIGPRAIQHHQSYLQMFRGAYPTGRTALIPYVL